MFFAIFFVTTRILQLLILIPTVGMLAWFVDNFTKANALTPASILVLFIVSTLALAWALFTVFSYHRSSSNGRFIALIDLAFVGAFIAGVYYLRGIASEDCTTVSVGRGNDWTANLGDIQVSGPGASISWRTEKRCAMLKASFAFGIIAAIQFFCTAIAAFFHGDDHVEYARRDRHHSSRHSHRRSHSGSRHSHHSHRRVYV
ncbi:uncharacterized protein F5Z01DRAFT_670113 [Emericellopsis atlantica]|uniref:MARVEL domain-containing protein n=1 Tax=Emericellopsis atlantica TaxID=2614577 RepID=A0A9P7ZVG1_9HYPO|nr:uncharacterized protein F5Z01DRAFT_670113 [Emericellopsis atlantica]KAG9258393.1 hypothetical protein F5Z01DRAFT_670113 [Emericellopsis atlantica]